MSKILEYSERAHQGREVQKLAREMMSSMDLGKASSVAQQYANLPQLSADEREIWRQVRQEIDRDVLG
jgi:hypothetical protein